MLCFVEHSRSAALQETQRAGREGGRAKELEEQLRRREHQLTSAAAALEEIKAQAQQREINTQVPLVSLCVSLYRSTRGWHLTMGAMGMYACFARNAAKAGGDWSDEQRQGDCLPRERQRLHRLHAQVSVFVCVFVRVCVHL